jgi:hypothetical protein
MLNQRMFRHKDMKDADKKHKLKIQTQQQPSKVVKHKTGQTLSLSPKLRGPQLRDKITHQMT